MSANRTSSSKKPVVNEPLTTSWPHDFSQEPEFNIGYVLTEVKKEFPALSTSKLRFLEDSGLLSPHRSETGYRKYSLANIERIRYILTLQRDKFLPLKLIHEKLQGLDAGVDVAEILPRTRVVAAGGVVSAPKNDYVTVRELCDLTGATKNQVEELTQIGLISPDTAGYFPALSVRVVNICLQLQQLGIPARNVRTVKTAAARHADLIDQVVSYTRGRNRSNDREKAYAEARDLGVVLNQLHEELLRIEIDKLNR
ncbi:MerR family transcriptional regulator [Gleimia sp. 6138-11-ORH1]|uniref:transcriptional regulator FtsR n=1 Tax=Gleimia sp. 6138-11-ORH1 TaxID=2973937 RepID=UPI00216A8E10|nr:MerR family transcriptional regulator [Gleimia sp. 6138-11-ORH1]MCS4484347.1 MerR family transcriptional regulator [Gleimia sp. 6138-11-ORH1]